MEARDSKALEGTRQKSEDHLINNITTILLKSDTQYKKILNDMEEQAVPITLVDLFLRLGAHAKAIGDLPGSKKVKEHAKAMVPSTNAKGEGKGNLRERTRKEKESEGKDPIPLGRSVATSRAVIGVCMETSASIRTVPQTHERGIAQPIRLLSLFKKC